MTFLSQLRDHGQVNCGMPQFLCLENKEHTFGDKMSTTNALLTRFQTLPFLPGLLPGYKKNSEGCTGGEA